MTASPEAAPFTPGDRVRWHNQPRMEGTVLKNNGGRCKVQWDTGEVRRDDPDKLRFASEEIVPLPFPSVPPVHAVLLTTSLSHPAGMASTFTDAAPVVMRNGSEEAAPAAEVRETCWTRGPWGLWPSYTGEPNTFEVGPDQFDTVAHVRLGADDVDGDCSANARLIASAPDLFASLNSMIEGFTTLALSAGWSRAHIAEATEEPRAALARATQQEAGDVE